MTLSFVMHSTIRPETTSGFSVADAASRLPVSSLASRTDPGDEPPAFASLDLEKDARIAAAVEDVGANMPVGYGHRLVTWVQARVLLVGWIPAVSQTGPTESLSGWQELPSVPLSRCTRSELPMYGDLHGLDVTGFEILHEGGVYLAQLRLGDGFRWSPWSSLSRRFVYSVPQPQPHSTEIDIETVAATVARCSWSAFLVPDGIHEVEYELRAVPVLEATTPAGARPAAATFIFPTSRARLQGELPHLLPATGYVFSVSARYLRVGWRSWGPCLRSSNWCLGLHSRVPEEDLTPTIPRRNPEEADWTAPPPPIALSHDGPQPFVCGPEGKLLFDAHQRAFLLGFPDTESALVKYRLEFSHVDVSGRGGCDARVVWSTPEVSPVEASPEVCAALLAIAPPWKSPPRLWRVLLPALAEKHALDPFRSAQHQRVQLRLAATDRTCCAASRWFSDATPPQTSAIAPPAQTSAALCPYDSHLGLEASFTLDRRLTVEGLHALYGNSVSNVEAELEQAMDDVEAGHAVADEDELPQGFGHAFVTRFQFRSRLSIRPPEESKTGPPRGIPWSAWSLSVDSGLQAASVSAEATSVKYTAALNLPDNAIFQFGYWYQVSVRVSDGITWSPWSSPSSPVKVFVAPPKPVYPDSAKLGLQITGTNVRLGWTLLKAHCGLRLVEYSVFVREVLHDCSDICPKRIAWQDIHAAHKDGETLSCELRDLRQDVSYVFTLAARYPNVGPREFEDALSSPPTSLRHVCGPLPVPMQIHLPGDRLRRMQVARVVLLRWSMKGLKHPGIDADPGEKAYELQVLPEGAAENQWLPCSGVQRMRVDGHTAWHVKDLPEHALRCRFRLWDRESGGLGQASPLMLVFVEPVARLGVTREVSTCASKIVLRVPLNAPHGSHEFVCRYQVRFRSEKVESEWTELPVKMLWHQHNDHLSNSDAQADIDGVVVSGLRRRVCDVLDACGEDLEASGSVARPPSVPTIPLASIGPLGAVSRQGCLVVPLGEEDGLQLSQAYLFSIRVGDLYRLSDWSEASPGEKLAPPPPSIPRDSTDALVVSDITGSSMRVGWCQMLPATGVPMHTEVEYLLSLSKRHGRKTESQVEAQWLVTSAFAEGTEPDATGEPLSVTIHNLHPYAAYELQLGVRYAKVGLRSWQVVQTYVAHTKHADRFKEKDRGTDDGAFSDSGPMKVCRKSGTSLKSPSPCAVGAGPGELFPLLSSTECPVQLPPIERTMSPSVPSQRDRLEWGEAQDPLRIIAGASALQSTRSADVAASVPSEVIPRHKVEIDRTGAYPRPDYVNFWRRDPVEARRETFDTRPAMPPMPGMPSLSSQKLASSARAHSERSRCPR